MAYTTNSLEGIKAFTKVAANGKYYFGGTFETKKNRVEDDFIGNLKGEMSYEGAKIISVSDADFGTLYYLATKLYLVDGFGNRLELNDNGGWDVVGVVDLDTTSTDVEDNGWGDTTETETGTGTNNPTKNATVGGWLGGVTDVLKGANDLLKGSNNATDSNNFDPEADSHKSNTVLYVIIALVVIIIGVIVYLLTKKKAPPVPIPVQPSQPLSGIHKPKRLS